MNWAKCEICGEQMSPGGGCTKASITIDGQAYDRIRATEDMVPSITGFIGVCHDCSVRPGAYHHWGCDVETCPKCGGQLISCECDAAIC